MRLIDGDRLFAEIKERHDMYTDCEYIGDKARRDELSAFMADIVNAPTVDVFQKLWNALYAEEDKFEKRYISTPEHDNWFLVYRPWLQDGFGIAITVLSEIFVPKPPKEDA